MKFGCVFSSFLVPCEQVCVPPHVAVCMVKRSREMARKYKILKRQQDCRHCSRFFYKYIVSQIDKNMEISYHKYIRLSDITESLCIVYYEAYELSFGFTENALEQPS
jgi:hypothetical protein